MLFSKNILYISWQYLRAFLLIYLCLILGNLISTLLPFSLPGSIIGMLILFSLLTIQIIPVQWIQPGCHLLLKNMTMLFIPIGVGIMNYYDTLSQQIIPILLSCIVSTLIIMIIVAYSSHYIHRETSINTSDTDKQQSKKQNSAKKNWPNNE
ncbi:CidA/LrgA family protein [Arsenophonus sp. aPb]|uniref:CidA/LrgA family protein n=1 Tax=Arsenophonus sp. aPb TaxID=3041619 RepID=UPI0024694907|nr:CidA/LrgA family protein [Arsenophonus sp. aPb]WGL99434.1 CidA/LrgA family protein [Arsenophonus sp. aPb]